jgi:hypothetical protein
MLDCCPKLSKFKAPKVLDLQTKSAHFALDLVDQFENKHLRTFQRAVENSNIAFVLF